MLQAFVSQVCVCACVWLFVCKSVSRCEADPITHWPCFVTRSQCSLQSVLQKLQHEHSLTPLPPNRAFWLQPVCVRVCVLLQHHCVPWLQLPYTLHSMCPRVQYSLCLTYARVFSLLISVNQFTLYEHVENKPSPRPAPRPCVTWLSHVADDSRCLHHIMCCHLTEEEKNSRC